MVAALVRWRLPSSLEGLATSIFGSKLEGASWPRIKSKQGKRMAQSRQLSKPPVVEAVIAIGFAFNSPPAIETLEALAKAITPSGGELREESSFKTRFVVDQKREPVLKNAAIRKSGFWIFERSSAYKLLLRPAEIVVQTSKYTDWGVLLDKLRSAFPRFVDACNPSGVSKISTRFINRIFIPGGGVSLEDYLTCGPTLPEGAPDALIGFQLVNIIRDDARVAAAAFKVQSGTPAQGLQPHIVIDIDVSTDSGLALDLDALQIRFEAIRELKNLLFFGALQEKALEPYI